jgi:hypothetical protein
MKKLFIVLMILAFTCPVWAADAEASPVAEAAKPVVQKETTILVYDVYKHMETSSHVFLGIGGLSLGIGIATAATAGSNQIALGTGLQMGIWGAAETALYLLDKNFSVKEKDPETARIKFAEASGWHAILDLAFMVGGGCMAIFGNDTIKGHGMGIMIQGAMLAAYDGINFFVASNPQDVKDWGAGVGYNVRFASK